MVSLIFIPMVCKDPSPSSILNHLLEGEHQVMELSSTKESGNEHFPTSKKQRNGMEKRTA